MVILINGLTLGDIVYLNPFIFEIITKEEADKIANFYPSHRFVITGPIKEEFKSFTDYVKRHKN